MNYLSVTISLLILLLFSACEGPEGDPGPEGPQGVAGEPGEIGFVMEWENVDFTASNDFKAILEFSEFDFEGLESDVALVFLKWRVDDNNNEIWRQIPQTLIVEEGILQYNYDFTFFDVELFMDADFDLNTLSANDTDDWVVRVVVVPGEFVGGRQAASQFSYEELADKLGLPELI